MSPPILHSKGFVGYLRTPYDVVSVLNPQVLLLFKSGCIYQRALSAQKQYEISASPPEIYFLQSMSNSTCSILL